MAARPMFEVDKEGLAKLLQARGKEFAIFEILANAWDENVRQVTVTLERLPERRGRCLLTVEDDSPEGFTDLTHAYTLFAESTKKSDAEKRGRFNLGEKLVLAICDEARIETTTGTVEFKGTERHHYPRRKRSAGTVFTGVLRMNAAEYSRACERIEMLLPPRGISTSFNGAALRSWDNGLISSFDATLGTALGDAEGVLRPTRRKTTVSLYESADKGWIYEMGIPVVETDLPVHVNVAQKVPLNSDRDNVTPAYLKELSAHVLNAVARRLDGDQAAASWINEAMERDEVDEAAVDAVLTKRFGDKRVIYDPSDPEGNKLAMSEGYTVIPGRAFSRDAWRTIKTHGSALPAGQVTPSPKPYSDDPNAPVRKDYTGEITPGMAAIIEATGRLGHKLMGVKVNVMLINDFGVPASAVYGKSGHRFEYNVARLGRAWFEQPPTSEDVLRLIIHEFGHEYSGDHLSSQYHDALCRLGARLAKLVLQEPGVFSGLAAEEVPA